MIRHIVYLCALAAFAQQHAPAPRGQKEFVQSCGFCHGEDATGGRAPDLVRSPLVAKDSAGDLIGPVIRSGRPDNGMPALPLPDNTIQDIVAFLHLRVKQAANSSNVGGDYPLERLLTGNADAGRAYFNGAGKCASCHSHRRPGGYREEICAAVPRGAHPRPAPRHRHADGHHAFGRTD